MSALPPKADIAERCWHVRFVPKPDIHNFGRCGRDYCRGCTQKGTAGRSETVARMNADVLPSARLLRTYWRPALRKAFAAFPADSKVVKASLAVMAIVVSTSDKLPPAAAASTAEAAAFSSGNSPMASQSW